MWRLLPFSNFILKLYGIDVVEFWIDLDCTFLGLVEFLGYVNCLFDLDLDVNVEFFAQLDLDVIRYWSLREHRNYKLLNSLFFMLSVNFLGFDHFLWTRNWRFEVHVGKLKILTSFVYQFIHLNTLAYWVSESVGIDLGFRIRKNIYVRVYFYISTLYTNSKLYQFIHFKTFSLMGFQKVLELILCHWKSTVKRET